MRKATSFFPRNRKCNLYILLDKFWQKRAIVHKLCYASSALSSFPDLKNIDVTHWSLFARNYSVKLPENCCNCLSLAFQRKGGYLIRGLTSFKSKFSCLVNCSASQTSCFSDRNHNFQLQHFYHTFKQN